MDESALIQDAIRVLEKNDLGDWTQPTAGLYPHQWLWDSCFIAIGLAHSNPARAQTEIRSLLKAQWKNGMLPHIRFSAATTYHAGPSLWKAKTSPNCPPAISSTGVSQPPLLAEAATRIGAQLSEKDRLAWYREIYPAIANFHEWLYRDRDPDRNGLVCVVHPWESGLDNTPPWMEVLHRLETPPKLWLLEKSRRTQMFVERFRKDTKSVPAEERMSTLDLLAIYELIKQLRHLHYDDQKILKKQKLILVDLVFNSILIRNNQLLKEMADAIGQSLPPLTEKAHRKGTAALDPFWDEATGQYYSSDRYGGLIKQPTIATFLPLYAGTILKTRVARLLEHLHNPHSFGSMYGVPSTPLNSPYFKPHCYWQGPVWINTNWLIIEGLRRNGQKKEAAALEKATIQLVSENGMHEYFSPLNGQAAGSSDFSWTAALTLDLLKRR